jgi:hypothetical protein
VVAPSPITSVEAPYPEGAQGDAVVVLELVIAEDGSVANAAVREGDAPFADAARLAAESFRFTPATRSGIPIRAKILLRIAFREPVAETPPPVDVTPEAGASERGFITPEGDGSEPVVSAGIEAPNPVSEEPVSVTVLGEQAPDLGSIHIPREDARRVPGAFGDPFRVVEALPGVAPVLSALPYFYVRGAPPGSVGYMIDGIRVPILFHLGSGPSVLAPLLVDRVDLFPGAYPARFGHYAGAILAGETAAPSERPRLEAQARIFDASAMVEQPVNDGRTTLLAAARYSYTQAILAAVAPDYELSYGDYQARISHQLNANDRVSVFGFGGLDRLHNRDLALTLFDVEFHRVDVRWDRTFEDGRFRLAATYLYDSVLAAPDDPGAPGTRQVRNGVRLRTEFEHAFGRAVRLRAGGDIGAEQVDGEQEQIDESFVRYPERVDRSGGVWADVVVRPARGVELVPGVRADFVRSRSEEHTFIEPRLSTRTRLFQGFAHLAGFGLANQVPTDSVRMPGLEPNLLELSRQESVQAWTGFEYALPASMLGRTTVFHQYVDIPGGGVHGRSYGIEQFLRRDFTEDLGGFLSYTLSRAEGEVGRETVFSSYDRTHVLSAVLGYDFGNGFRFGGRAYYASGRPYGIWCPTVDCAPGGDPEAEPVDLKRGRLPGFFRVDLRFEKKWRFPSGFWITANAEWFNASLSPEVDGIYYTPQGLVHNEQSPLTLPSIGVELGY